MMTALHVPTGLLLLLLLLCVQGQPHAASVPHGLLANFQASPALGVPPSHLEFSWVVPPGDEADHGQVAYHIVVTDALDEKKVVWDSGVVQSTRSIGVAYGGPVLPPGKALNWTVAVETRGARVTGAVTRTSAPALPATIITSLHAGFAEGASYIWSGPAPDTTAAQAPKPAGIFAFLRKIVPKPAANILRATAFITAVTDDYMLCGYRLYIGGSLVNVGPGRGEAVVWGGNGTYMEKPYQTLDVTASVLTASAAGSGDVLLAIQGLGSTGSTGRDGPACAGPCAGLGPKISAGVLMQLVLELEGGATTTVVTDSSWDAFDADLYMKPTPGKNWYKHVLESTDARAEPVGWRSELSFKPAGTGWGKAITVLPAAGNMPGLHPKMSRPVEVFDVPAPSADKIIKLDPGVMGGRSDCYTIDFTREFQVSEHPRYSACCPTLGFI